MKRVLTVPVVLITLALAACGSSESSSTPTSTAASTPTTTTAPEPETVYTQEDVSELASATEDEEVENTRVEKVTGQAFNIQKSGDVTGVQIHTDVENSDADLIVILPPGEKVREDDFIQVSGPVVDLFTGENAFGTELKIPRVQGETIKQVDASIVNPATKTYKRSKTQTVAGVTITVRKVEIAENETRVYVRYRNQSSETFYPDITLISGEEDIDTQYNDNYKDPKSDLSSGATTSGVLLFEDVDEDDPLKLTFKFNDSDYNDVSAVFTYGS